MKKKIVTYMMALLGMCVLMACGGGGDDSGGSGGSGGGGGSVPQTYTQSITIAATGGTQSLKLNNLSSAVSSVSSTPNWLVISPEYYSSGAPSIKLEVQENTSADERKCDVTVLAASGDKVVLTVTQQAGEGSDIDDIHNTDTDQPAYAPLR